MSQTAFHPNVRAAEQIRLEERVRALAVKVFPNVSVEGITHHLIKEAQELHEAPADLAEAADILILLTHLMIKQRRSLDDLIHAAHLKMDCNERRKWHPADRLGCVHHVKEAGHAR